MCPAASRCRSGLYLSSRFVVGSRTLADATRLSLLVASRLVPASPNPTDVEQQGVQRGRMVHDGLAGGAGGVQDRQDVLGGRGVGVVEVLERAPVLADDLAAVVERRQHLVEIGGGLTHPFTLSAHRVGHRGQHRVQLRRIDHLDQVDDVFEDRVDLCADVLRTQHRAGGQPFFTRVLRIHQVDELGAERGGDVDLCLDIGRDVLDLIGIDLQRQARPVLGGADLADPAHLNATHLDLGVGLHDDPGSFRRQRHRHGGFERACEDRRGHEEEHGGKPEQHQRPPPGADALFSWPHVHAASPPG